MRKERGGKATAVTNWNATRRGARTHKRTQNVEPNAQTPRDEAAAGAARQTAVRVRARKQRISVAIESTQPNATNEHPGNAGGSNRVGVLRGKRDRPAITNEQRTSR